MRIAIPIHSFEPGGVERVGLRLAEQWQAAGQEVIVVLGRSRGQAKLSAPDLQYRTRREPIATDRWETLWMIWSMLRFLLRERVDVVFCPGNTYSIVCVAMKLLLRRRCPPVLVKISNDLERRDMPALYRAAYHFWLRVQGRCLESFVGIGDPMRAEIKHRLAVESGRITVIPDPAISETELARLSRPRQNQGQGRDGCRYLNMGRLVTQKNQALLLRAFATGCRPGDSLLIAGEGPERARLSRLVGDLRLEQRVRLPGHVDDPVAAFADADVLVISSDYEGVPAVVIEAIAAGVPIISTDCSSSMDWLTGSGKFGLLVPRGDDRALAEAICQAPGLNPDRRAMRRFAQQFTIERSSGSYLEQLDRLACKARQRRIAEIRSQVRDWRRRGV
ncbi:glycosyltransferase [Qipengyuania sp. YG27]|uniref:Glycosyltransferase n=1 Tax=Qipengyuania mesophila TaxID=2867246 RepID=A0ABS7JWX9_9SPHN|nr:glycosyltransferase [Qipengyuania mesophila]MBX7502165.1 glycosyltransferase [Qipengyuania mesophila]